MKNIVKLGLLVTTATGIVAVLNAIDTKEERTKKEVIKVWDSIKDEIITTLSLKVEPTLVFDHVDKCIMAVYHTEMSQRSFMSKSIVSTETDSIIHVNLKTLTNVLTYYKAGTFFMCSDITRILLSQLLYHECRHIWQAEGTFYVGRQYSLFECSINKGHGEAPEEVDANEFACSMAKNKREKILAKLQKKEQEESGKIYYKASTVEKAAFIKEFNPILRLFM